MAFALHIPRVNNNDDEVRLVKFWVEPGAFVEAGQPVADVETAKATVTVESEKAGFVLSLNGATDTMVDVGGVLAWLGDSAAETPPALASGQAQSDGSPGAVKAPTLRAAMLMAQHGLEASAIAAAGDRITAGDVEQHVASHPKTKPQQSQAPAPREDAPAAEGKLTPLTPQHRGMLHTVSWQKAHAVPGYVELAFDEEAWTAHAAAFQAQRNLMMSPLLALLGWRLVQIVMDRRELNATLHQGQRFAYDPINFGSTVQSGNDLYVVVVRSAETMDEAAFVDRLGELQRAAMKKALKADETQGATIGFSSMARWQATRHVPILLPHTALMVAHAASQKGQGVLGATYDHRVLTGADAIVALRQLASPHGA